MMMMKMKQLTLLTSTLIFQFNSISTSILTSSNHIQRDNRWTLNNLRLRGGALYGASLTRWQHSDPSIREPVHMAITVNTTMVSWIGRSSVKEILSLLMRTAVAKSRATEFARIDSELHGRKCCLYVISRPDGLAGTLVTDPSYPERVAINLMEKFMEDFASHLGGQWPQSRADECASYPQLEDLLAKYQDPAEADQLEGVKRDLYATHAVLQKSVDAILERGQKLDDLILQSNRLSMQTKAMYKSVQKAPGWFDQCCGTD